MLKRRGLVILVFAFSLFNFFNVIYASNHVAVNLETKQDVVNNGEEIEITVNVENNKIAACNFSIYFEEEKLEFISDFNEEDTMTNINVIGNRLSFVWFDKLGGEGAKEGNVATFKFRAKENGIAMFTINGEFYNQKGQLIETSFKEKHVKIGKEKSNLQEQVQEEQGTNLEDSNCDLKVLRIDKEGLVPNFEKGVQEYYLMVPNNVQNIEVLAISENPNAIVEVKGNTNLRDKLNDIIVKVISSDKTLNKVYTIHVSKTDNLDLANSNLEVLAIENALLTPPFEASHTNYEIEVSNQTDTLNIFAVPEDEQANVEIMGENNLKDGSNLVTVLVKAQNGFTKKAYKINVNRRTKEKEKEYQKEKEKQKEDLENAYKIEKTSVNINNVENQNNKKQDKTNETIKVLIIAGILIIGTFIALMTWKKQHFI